MHAHVVHLAGRHCTSSHYYAQEAAIGSNCCFTLGRPASSGLLLACVQSNFAGSGVSSPLQQILVSNSQILLKQSKALPSAPSFALSR